MENIEIEYEELRVISVIHNERNRAIEGREKERWKDKFWNKEKLSFLGLSFQDWGMEKVEEENESGMLALKEAFST